MTRQIFQLRSQRLDFYLVRQFRNALGTLCVYGITRCGRWQTTARTEDVVFLL